MGVLASKRGGFVSDINVTPFVDVMLVLLIIFMVTAPLMTEGLQVDLPQTQSVEVLPTESGHMVLTIRKDGVLFLDEYSVEQSNLIHQLLVNVKEKNKQLFLQADKDVPYGIVVDVMGRVRAAGIEKLGVIAEKPGDLPVQPGQVTQPMQPGQSGQPIQQGNAVQVPTRPDVVRPMRQAQGADVARPVQVSPDSLMRGGRR